MRYSESLEGRNALKGVGVQQRIARKTALGIQLHVAGVRIPRVGLIWPTKAAVKNEFTFTGVQGGIDPGETSSAAMRREVWEELGIEVERLRPLFQCQPRVTRPGQGQLKSYAVYLVVTGWRVYPNPAEVTEFAWWRGPDELRHALAFMSETKRKILDTGLQLTAQHLPALRCYREAFEEERNCR